MDSRLSTNLEEKKAYQLESIPAFMKTDLFSSVISSKYLSRHKVQKSELFDKNCLIDKEYFLFENYLKILKF
jgi:hypothetical protein